MAMTAKNMPYKQGFGPFASEVYRAPVSYPFRDGLSGPEAAARAIDQLDKQVGAGNLACVVVEPILGEGGFVVPAPGFLSVLAEWCRAHGIVFVAYCLTTVLVAVDQRWSFGRTLLGLAAAVPPFFTVFFDWYAERRSAIAESWRLRDAAPSGRAAVAGPSKMVQTGVLARSLARYSFVSLLTFSFLILSRTSAWTSKKGLCVASWRSVTRTMYSPRGSSMMRLSLPTGRVKMACSITCDAKAP